MAKIVDLIGKTFGRIVVLSKQGSSKTRGTLWNCVCSCGKSTIVSTTLLNSGKTQSCGCYNRERIKEKLTTHSLSDSLEYRCYHAMKNRCNNPNIKSYEDYGNRGIAVCDEWLGVMGFETFIGDMGKMPNYDENWSVERLNPNLGYSKENCIWLQKEKQARNKTMYRNNTSGKTGVVFYFDKYHNKFYKAHWTDLNGKLKTKTFSVNKYGEDMAFEMACDYRKAMINSLNEMNAGYSENHGSEKDIYE